MRVVWTAEAADDLADTLAYIAARSPQGAANVAARIEAAVDSIGQFPHAGRLDPKTGCRERVIGRYPLLLVYTVDDAQNLVEIIALFHTARDPQDKRRP